MTDSTTASPTFAEQFQNLLFYGGKAYIDKHASYHEQPSPQVQPVQNVQTQTPQGQAAPNQTSTDKALSLVSENQKPLLIGFGLLLAGALIWKVAT